MQNSALDYFGKHYVYNPFSDRQTLRYSELSQLQSCLTLCSVLDCSTPDSVHALLQARILEWVAMSSSKASIIKKTFQSF